MANIARKSPGAVHPAFISRAVCARANPAVRCRFARTGPLSALLAFQYENRRNVRTTCAYGSARDGTSAPSGGVSGNYRTCSKVARVAKSSCKIILRRSA